MIYDTINKLETFMYLFNNDCFVVGGDLNTDYSRDNAKTKFVKEFCNRIKLTLCTSSFKHNFSFTRSNNDSRNPSHSLIDHFAISTGFAVDNFLQKSSLLDDTVIFLMNLSDHRAVSLSVYFLLLYSILLLSTIIVDIQLLCGIKHKVLIWIHSRHV